MHEVETIPDSCPVCGGEVKGADDVLFFCSKCNLLFSRQSLKGQPMREQQRF